MSEPWNGYHVFHKLHLVFGIVAIGVIWVLCSIGEPRRRPWWLIALVIAALLGLIVYAVLELRSVPSVETK